MLRISRLTLPERTFTQRELERAFQEADFGRVRVPGRKQVMDAHEVRGLFQTYLSMAGATWEGPNAETIEVPEHARPFVEALQKVHARLVEDGEGAFVIEPADDA